MRRRRSGSVSYTHLAVYKRQLPCIVEKVISNKVNEHLSLRDVQCADVVSPHCGGGIERRGLWPEYSDVIEIRKPVIEGAHDLGAFQVKDFI